MIFFVSTETASRHRYASFFARIDGDPSQFIKSQYIDRDLRLTNAAWLTGKDLRA